MRKLILSLSLFAAAVTVKAQQDAQYTQFFMSKLSYNPAYAGSEDKICATGLYRSQWLGFGSSSLGGSPVTFVGNIHAPIGTKFGVGLDIRSEQLGFEQSLNPMLSLAYRQPFKNGSTLAGGLGVGFMQKTLAGDKLKPLDEGDRYIPNISVSGNALDLDIGLYYTMPSLWRFTDVYAGLSATHLTGGDVAYEYAGNTINNSMQSHLYFMTGGSYELTPSLSLEPNILVKSDFAKATADFNAMVTYNNKIRGGITYRTADAVSLLLGYKINNIGANGSMYIGYSYDLTTSNIISYSSGSHEIVLKYCFMPKVKPPKDKEIVPRLTPRFL
jgi:type IX secretion system PorP/SprF family membrane protein